MVSRVNFEKILMFSVLITISAALSIPIPMAFSDNLNIVGGPGQVFQIVPGEEKTVQVKIVASSSQGGDNDPSGESCNTLDGTQSTIVIDVPEGVTLVTPSGTDEILVADCNVFYDITVTATQAGLYLISLTVRDADPLGDFFGLNADFSIEIIDSTPPEVSSIASAPTTITDEFPSPTLTIVFNEPMRASPAPTVTIDPLAQISGYLAVDPNPLNSYWQDNLTYVAAFVGTPSDIEETAVKVSVADAQDLAGNTMVATPGEPNTREAFDVDTGVGGSFVLNKDHNDEKDHTYSNDTNLIITCDDIDTIEVLSDNLSSGAGTYDVCNPGPTDDSIGVTLANGRGDKVICTIPKDALGNTNSANTCHTIRLDSSFTGLTVSPASAPWGNEVTISGTLNNSLTGDNAHIYFGSPDFTVLVNPDGTFSKTSVYLKPSVDPGVPPYYSHQPSVDGVTIDGVDEIPITNAHDVPLTGNTQTGHTVEQHDVVITFKNVQSPLPYGKFTITGDAVDTDVLDNDGIPNLLLAFTVEGEANPGDFPNTLTNGITLNGVTGDTIDAVGTYWEFPVGSTILLPKSKVVTIGILGVDIGQAVNLQLYTDANNEGSSTLWTINGVGLLGGTSQTRTSVAGFEKIVVLANSGGGTANISNIVTKSGNDITIFDISPSTPGLGGSFDTKTVKPGRFVAEGFAKSTPEENLDIEAIVQSIDYTGSGTWEYDIIEGATPLTQLTGESGFGGAESFYADRGTGRIMQTCATDTDKDGACDGQEGTGNGITFKINGVDYIYKLPGSNPLRKQIWVEHDAINYHKPTQANLDLVKTAFANSPVVNYEATPTTGIDLINTLSDTIATVPGGTTLYHGTGESNIAVWGDPSPNNVRTDDFNTIKADWFGTAGEKVVLGGTRSITPATTLTAATATSNNIVISSNNFKVPTAPPTTATATVGAVVRAGTTTGTGGATEGSISYTFKLTPSAVYTTTCNGPDNNPQDGVRELWFTAPVPLSVGTVTFATNANNFPTAPTATLSTYEGAPYQTLTVKIPFKTTATVTTAISIPQLTIQILNSGGTDSCGYPYGSPFAGTNTVTMVVLSPSPSYTTTLLDAKAYVYRYALWIHCPQSAACGTTGGGELGGNDMFIAMGKGMGGTNPSGHTTTGYSVGSSQEQTGTFMHELGHTLNLKHGGPNAWLSLAPEPSNIGNDNDQNCKPPYFSVMSYSRQMNTYLTATSGNLAWVLGYSTGTRPAIIENQLCENISGLQLQSAVYGPSITLGQSPNITSDDFRIMSGSETFVDWNWDISPGNNNPLPDVQSQPMAGAICSTPVTANVNNINIVGCNSSDIADSSKPLRDYDDWNNLKLPFANAAGTYDGYSPFQSEANGKQRAQVIFAASNDDITTPTTAHSSWGWSSTFNVVFKLVDAQGNIFQMPGLTADVWRDGLTTCPSSVTRQVSVGGTDATPGPVKTFCKVGQAVYSENDKSVKFAYKFLKEDRLKKIYFIVEKVSLFDVPPELVKDFYPPTPIPDRNTSFDVSIN